MASPTNANSYFQFSTNYLSVFQKNMYAETVQMFGYDCVYIPINFIEGDINYIFGEVNKVYYTNAFNIRMYINNYDELQEAFNSYIKFGMLLLPESLEASVSKEDYNSIIMEDSSGSMAVIQPKSGDLIYFNIHNESVLFEITHINLLYDSFYTFLIRLYNYDATNSISTGITDIDNVEDSDVTTVDQNQEIEDANDEFQDQTKRHNVWGSY